MSSIDQKQSSPARSARIPKRKLERHGRTRTKEYRAWLDAKSRCYNPNNPHYAAYGGSAIRMCEEWRTSFSKFYEDMGPCPEGYSLDRINTLKGYEPGNCRWASQRQQLQNRVRRLKPRTEWSYPNKLTIESFGVYIPPRKIGTCACGRDVYEFGTTCGKADCESAHRSVKKNGNQ